MTRRLGLRLLSVGLPLALLAPGAAHAERIATADAVGDVVQEDWDAVVSSEASADAEPDPYLPAPDNESADIVRTVVDHRASALTVTASFRDLVDTTYDGLVFRIRTPRRVFDVLVERRGKHALTTWAVRRGPTCGRVRTTADSRDERITLHLPTDCIGAPRSVRVAVGVISQVVTHDPQAGDSIDKFIDDAFSVGFGPSGDRLVFGPEVRRG